MLLIKREQYSSFFLVNKYNLSMKSKIKFFYNLFIDNIVSYEEYSIIESNNNVYILKKIYNTSPSLFTNNDYFEIISNNYHVLVVHP